MTRKRIVLNSLWWLAILLTVLISVGTSYEKRSFLELTSQEMAWPTHDDLIISYKDVTIHWGSARVYGNYAGLFTAPKRSWYFGKIDRNLNPSLSPSPRRSSSRSILMTHRKSLYCWNSKSIKGSSAPIGSMDSRTFKNIATSCMR